VIVIEGVKDHTKVNAAVIDAFMISNGMSCVIVRMNHHNLIS